MKVDRTVQGGKEARCGCTCGEMTGFQHEMDGRMQRKRRKRRVPCHCGDGSQCVGRFQKMVTAVPDTFEPVLCVNCPQGDGHECV